MGSIYHQILDLKEYFRLYDEADALVEVPSPYTDVYLFDPENRWCYIHTHEPDCGPYFLES